MDQGHGDSCGHTTSEAERETDPVCGMTVDPTTTPHRLVHGQSTYHFCSARCLDKFKGNPDKYLNPAAHDPAVTHPAMGALTEAAAGTVVIS